MGGREHSRFEIWNAAQHPYKHPLSDFSYSNPALPVGTTLQSAVDYLFAVLYPQMKPAVATTADLPLVGNTLNDMRVVTDDGDGKSASYRWEQREGEVAASWHKIYDVDFGTDSILQAWEIKTQDVYVSRFGYDDRDKDGVVIAGLYAGQTIYGGKSVNTNMTLRANSGDGTGAATGYVQVDDQFRPAVTNTYDAGNASFLWRNVYATTLHGGDISIATGAISATGLAIAFGTTVLSNTAGATFGNITLGTNAISAGGGTIAWSSNAFTGVGAIGAASVTATTNVSSFKSGTTIGNLTLSSGSITDSGLAISFGSCALSTTGTANFGATTATSFIAGTLTVADGSISDSDGAISFGSTNLSTTGTLAAGATTITGAMVATTAKGGNLLLATNTLSSTNTDGNIAISPNGTGVVTVSSIFKPTTDAARDLGATALRWQSIYLSGSLGDGTNTIAIATLLSFRNALSGASSGMTLFYDGSTWNASVPDSEITHNTLSGLTTGDAGHTQFALLAGRSGGQSLNGGTAASENLTLDSTGHATKGKILAKSDVAANTDAVFSSSWSGTNLGGASNRFNNIYTAGEMVGMRLENIPTVSAPTSSAQRAGRVYFDSTSLWTYLDNGSAVVKLGPVNVFQSDTSWDGSTLTKTVSVTTTGMDARKALWQLRDNSNSYKQVFLEITATGASTVVLTSNINLPAGSYRLTGLEY